MKLSPLFLSIISVLPITSLMAQDAELSSKTLDTLIVTGTHVSDRTVAESASPIDILTPAALQATGTTELATALARALPSLNFPRPALVDGTDAVRPAQLRGLSPDQVLVLINGKRRHSTALVNVNGSQGRGSSPVDLNAIPIAAIERIEVLRDGASAQYGSDAIAGVINIVLKGSNRGGSLAGTYGQYSAGDGAQYLVSGDAGLHFGKDENNYLHLSAQAGHQDQSDRAGPFQGTPSASNPQLGQVVQRFGDPEVRQRAFAFNAGLYPAEGVEFYSFGTFSQRNVTSNGFFRAPGAGNNIIELYPNGYLPQIYNESRDISIVEGVKGTTEGGLMIDIGYNYGQSRIDFEVHNSLNRSLGLATPTRFDIGRLQSTQHVLNMDFNKSLEVGLEYPINVAFGTEWRGEVFQQSAGEPASYINGGVLAPNETTPRPGSQVFTGFSPDDSGRYDRNSFSYYLNIEADLTDKLSIGLAGRFEDYSDFGNTSSGKFSARYAFTDKVALRGTVSTGFRAPSLQQQYYQSTSSSFIRGEQYAIRTFKADDPAAIALGSEPLKAEESTNYSLGLVLQPIDNLYITVDAYRINIDDRIVLSENLVTTPIADYLIAQGYSATGGRYFTNAVDTRTDGVDVIGTYKLDLSNSSLDFTMGYNYNKTKILDIAENPAKLMEIDPNALRIGYSELGRITKGSPRDKLFLGTTWSLGDWKFNAAATRYGQFSVLDNRGNTALDQTFSANWTVDLSVQYSLKQWNFTLGGDNVLNQYPDKVIFATSSSGQLPYSSNSPYGFNGAYLYSRINYKW